MRSIPVGMIPTNAFSPKISIVSASFFFGRNFMLNFDFHFTTPSHTKHYEHYSIEKHGVRIILIIRFSRFDKEHKYKNYVQNTNQNPKSCKHYTTSLSFNPQ